MQVLDRCLCSKLYVNETLSYFFTKINGVHESTPTTMPFLDLTVRVTIRFLFSKKYVSVSNLFDSGLGKLGLLVHESLCSLKQEVQGRGV